MAALHCSPAATFQFAHELPTIVRVLGGPHALTPTEIGEVLRKVRHNLNFIVRSSKQSRIGTNYLPQAIGTKKLPDRQINVQVTFFFAANFILKVLAGRQGFEPR